MKINRLLLFYLMIICFSQASAQYRITLQHNGATTVFGGSQPLTDAYNQSVDGDTIYLAGAYYDGITVNKRLTIIGTGHYPDSTSVTGVSRINGITLGANAGNSVFEGISINGITTNSEAKVDNIRLLKCYINGSINISGSFLPATRSDNWHIYQNVIMGNINCNNASNVRIYNNLIASSVTNIVQNGTISNNVFLLSANWIFVSVYESLIQNNIIMGPQGYVMLYGQNNLLQKNIFINGAPTLGTNNTDLNNYYPVNQSDIFMNQTGFSFDYTHNYHLKTPASYVGSDGTQVGIYGGVTPYKEYAVPSNPHFISKSIAPTTNSNGKLGVNIKVSAQEN